MKIVIIGSGCATCRKLHETVIEVVKKENIGAEIEYSTDITRIVELGLMRSPVLLIDGKTVDLTTNSEKHVREAIFSTIYQGRQ